MPIFNQPSTMIQLANFQPGKRYRLFCPENLLSDIPSIVGLNVYGSVSEEKNGPVTKWMSFNDDVFQVTGEPEGWAFNNEPEAPEQYWIPVILPDSKISGWLYLGDRFHEDVKFEKVTP